MTTTPVPVQNDPQLALQLLLAILGVTASSISVAAGGTSSDVGKGAAVAAGLIQITQKAMAAYQAQTGKPIEPELLRPFEPLVDEPAPAE